MDWKYTWGHCASPMASVQTWNMAGVVRYCTTTIFVLDLPVDGHQRSECRAQHETMMRYYFASEEYSNTFYAKS